MLLQSTARKPLRKTVKPGSEEDSVLAEFADAGQVGVTTHIGRVSLKDSPAIVNTYTVRAGVDVEQLEAESGLEF